MLSFEPPYGPLCVVDPDGVSLVAFLGRGDEAFGGVPTEEKADRLVIRIGNQVVALTHDQAANAVYYLNQFAETLAREAETTDCPGTVADSVAAANREPS